MTSKTFKHVDANGNESKLDICRVPAGVRLTLSTHTTISGWFHPNQGAEIALAILEAAVGENSGQSIHSERAIANLQAEVACMAERAAAEADRVKLEAEARGLYAAHGSASDMPYQDWEHLPEQYKGPWLAVARAARELNKETGQ